MEIVETQYNSELWYKGVMMAYYRRYRDLYIGRTMHLNIIYDGNSYLRCANSANIITIGIEGYEWIITLYNLLSEDSSVDSELLDKCLDLYYLLEYRYGKSRTNVYSGNIPAVSYVPIYSSRFKIENNVVSLGWRNYNVSDDFAKRAQLANISNVMDAIYKEEAEIWRSAFPTKVKSARN
jgi:hypothetical protein